VSQNDYQALHLQLSEGIATVLIDNPPINLFDRALFPEIRRAADELSTNEDVRVVVLRSSVPGFFIAHFDASLIREVPLEGDDLVRRRDDWTEMCEAFRTMPKATIAVIEGRIGGGGNELALACDMRFAARETAVFNQWEVAVGLLPGGGGLTRLARLMGRSRAMEVILACDDFDADLAERYGWVNRALPQAEMDAFIERLTSRIASFPPYAVAAAKEAVLRVEKDIMDDLLAEREPTSRVRRLPATREAVDRFLREGGQTVEGEVRLGDLLGELAVKPG
jgi:enoyl-CoA hydratase/carnithine racemase